MSIVDMLSKRFQSSLRKMRNLQEFDEGNCQNTADSIDAQCIPEIDADVLEVMTFPTDLDLLSISHDPERDLDEVSQSEDCAGNLSGSSSGSGVLCAEKAVSVSVDLLEEDLVLSDSDSDSDDDVPDDVRSWTHESVAASFLAATSGYSSDSESDSEDTVVARRKSAPLRRQSESQEIVSDDELSDNEGCDVTIKRRRYNRLEKERTDFTQSSNKGSSSPESGSSQEKTSSSESESSDSSSSDSDIDESTSGSSSESDSDSDDSTSGSSSESDSDSDESSSGSSSDSDSRSCSSSSASNSSSDDSDSGTDGDDAREIDLKFDKNPCPATCVCRSGSNMLQIPPARRRRTEQSLYNEVLNRQLLKSYNAAREIDLRFEENPCPKTCVCRSSRNMLQVRRAHRRETEPPLYRVVLSRRLLRPSNRIVHDCCKYRCSRSCFPGFSTGPAITSKEVS
ncbi:uncharacterized protein LOC127838014 isoform X2 [Dreissena polymorpha]|uniref:uncharacterized protein LOC127838014 isoform X2 n=1 Tax=Dreissena polymorpha TaxID=45954 RepID=UPI0022649076|nr:uncharacterized protein LOC127838014 isoform X2 [Dreissena polymorpha]